MTMVAAPAPLKENLGPFIPLRGEDLAVLMEEPVTRTAYLDALGLMHDMVCELSDSPIHAGSGVEEVRTAMREVVDEHFADDRSLSRHVRENWETALMLREDLFFKVRSAEEGVVRSEIASFVSGLLFAYNQVRGLHA
jgi:hypothetical protein